MNGCRGELPYYISERRGGQGCQYRSGPATMENVTDFADSSRADLPEVDGGGVGFEIAL